MGGLDHITDERRQSFSIQQGENIASGAILLRLLSSSGDVTFTVSGDGHATLKSLNLNGLPTSATGLSSGDVWNDNGTLKIVA